MKLSIIKLAAVLLLLPIFQTKAIELDSKDRDPKYVENILGRAQKNIDKISLSDDSTKTAVKHIIANRYFQLNDIYSKRDAAIKAAKDSLKDEAKDTAVKLAKMECDASLYRQHFDFASKLSMYLTPEQVIAVKDGMTFGVVEVTYKATTDMVPTLTEEEKKQIRIWLEEAREFAMDAENSNKKHEAFGKYKGRINNYLSQRGYDLVKEREQWYKRMDAQGIKY